MSEVKPEAVSPEEAGNVAPEVQPEQSSGIRYTETIAEAKAKIAAEKEGVTAESLGVDKASYDKYYRNGEFDWASYGREQAFKAKQASSKETKPAENADVKPAESAENTPAEPATEGEQAARDAVAQAGLNWDDLVNQLLQNNDISPEAKESLKKIGIPEDVINNYIEMVNASTDAVVTRVVQGFGGEEQFTAVFNGLQENATSEQQRVVDDLLADDRTFQDGVALARKLAGVPAPKTLPKEFGGANANVGATTSAQGYASFNEQMAAMRDPRYKNDPEYRGEVMKRIAASTYDLNPRAHTSGL